MKSPAAAPISSSPSVSPLLLLPWLQIYTDEPRADKVGAELGDDEWRWRCNHCANLLNPQKLSRRPPPLSLTHSPDSPAEFVNSD